MRYAALLLVLLMGCAGTQHRHPHDHGLSAFKGQLNRIFKDNEHMFRRFQGLQINTDKVRAKNVALESRLDAVENALLKLDILEASVTRMDKELIALQKKTIAEKKEESLTFGAMDRNFSVLESDLEDLEDTLDDLEETVAGLKPPPLQRFIELGPDPKEDEPWDGKMIGPPLPKVGVELGEEKD